MIPAHTPWLVISVDTIGIPRCILAAEDRNVAAEKAEAYWDREANDGEIVRVVHKDHPWAQACDKRLV